MKTTKWLFLLVAFMFSCTKKIEVQGTVSGGLPSTRVEIIEAWGVSMLPLVNMGVDAKGNFSGEFEASKNGMYVIVYEGRQNFVYLKTGQKLEMQGKAKDFPVEVSIKGDAKNNNDFLKQTQKIMNEYTMKLNFQAELMKDEASFVKFLTKIETDLTKKFDDIAKKTKADDEVLKWKKEDLKTGLLATIPQFTEFKKQVTGNLNYTTPKVLADFEEKLQENKENLVKEHPIYRQYLLSKLSDGFQKYMEANQNKNPQKNNTQLFNDFIKQRKELSQTAKDFLLAFIMTQFEITPELTNKQKKDLQTLIETEIKEKSVREDMKKLLFVVRGFDIGEELPKTKLAKEDKTSFDFTSLKGKPTLIVHYASWTPGLQEYAMPVVKQMVQFYQSKMNIVFINFDDTREQFEKTNKSLLKDVKGIKLYAEGGLKSDYAEKMGIYSFKLSPSFMILDKNGKVAGRLFFNAGDQQFVELMDKQSGLKAPAIQPEVVLETMPPTSLPAEK